MDLLSRQTLAVLYVSTKKCEVRSPWGPAPVTPPGLTGSSNSSHSPWEPRRKPAAPRPCSPHPSTCSPDLPQSHPLPLCPQSAPMQILRATLTPKAAQTLLRSEPPTTAVCTEARRAPCGPFPGIPSPREPHSHGRTCQSCPVPQDLGMCKSRPPAPSACSGLCFGCTFGGAVQDGLPKGEPTCLSCPLPLPLEHVAPPELPSTPDLPVSCTPHDHGPQCRPGGGTGRRRQRSALCS